MSHGRGSRAGVVFGLALAVVTVRLVFGLFMLVFRIVGLFFTLPFFPVPRPPRGAPPGSRLVKLKPQLQIEYEYVDPPPGYEPIFTHQRGQKIRRVKEKRWEYPGLPSAPKRETLKSAPIARGPLVVPLAPVEQDLFNTLKTLGFGQQPSMYTAKHVYGSNPGVPLNDLIKIALKELRP